MQRVLDFLMKAMDVPLDRLVALVALAGLGVAFFAIYVVFAVVVG